MPFGDLILTPLWDGSFRLDGGAMFGVVPKPLWEKRAPADERNRIRLGLGLSWFRARRPCSSMPASAARWTPRAPTSTPSIAARNLDHSLADAGLSRDAIDIVLATHLHFDHAGGFTSRDSAGNLSPAFPARPLHRPHR